MSRRSEKVNRLASGHGLSDEGRRQLSSGGLHRLSLPDQLRQLVGWEWASDQIALREVAGGVGEPVELGRCFDAFGDDERAESMSEIDVLRTIASLFVSSGMPVTKQRSILTCWIGSWRKLASDE